MSKVFVFGIDGAPPEYVFGAWLKELPNIKSIMDKGCYGSLQSTIPPLSAVAWTSITTGKPPQDTGIFEYIYRKNNDFKDYHVITSKNIKEKSVWQIASEYGKKSIVTFIPITWPIKPFNGIMVTGLLTPSGEDVKYTYPEEIKTEMKAISEKQFHLDVADFRNLTKEEIIELGYDTTKSNVELIKNFIKNKEWDLIFSVIQISDRLNHIFWRFLDENHRRYEPNSPYSSVLKDYLKYVDKKLGEILALLDDDTTIIILSDHGMLSMHNRINLSDWLIKESYLVLKEPVSEKIKLDKSMIDWTKTKVFAIGAYEGQLFINLKGREPEGIVTVSEYDSLVEELKSKLELIRGDDGSKLNTKIFTKKEDFQGSHNSHAPDILVYFDNLHYGCNTSLIGNDTLWSLETAVGKDDCGHSHAGIFCMNDSRTKGKMKGLCVLDIAPTILAKLGINPKPYMGGKVIE